MRTPVSLSTKRAPGFITEVNYTMARRLVKEYVVDDATGEVTPHARLPREPHFVRVYQEAKLAMRQQGIFTLAERDLLDALEGCVELGSNALADRHHAYSLREVAERTGLNIGNVSRTMRQLIRKNAVALVEKGDGRTYYVNPVLFAAGPVDPWVKELFATRLRDRMREGAEAVRAGRKVYPIARWDDSLNKMHASETATPYGATQSAISG